MLRRSFRVGLRLGLLAGVVFALVKLVQSRRAGGEDGPGPTVDHGDWPPMQPEPVAVEPPAQTVPDRLPAVRRGPVDSEPPPAAAPSPAPAEAGAAAHRPGAEPPATPAVPPMGAVIPPPEPPADTGTDAPTGTGPAAAAPKGTEAPKGTKAAKTSKAAKKRPPVRQPAGESAAAKATTRVRKARRQGWVEPVDDEAPGSHPVKAKLSSMLYHLPGMAAYKRTRPDRCYADAEAAEADGFTRAKR